MILDADKPSSAEILKKLVRNNFLINVPLAEMNLGTVGVDPILLFLRSYFSIQLLIILVQPKNRECLDYN